MIYAALVALSIIIAIYLLRDAENDRDYGINKYLKRAWLRHTITGIEQAIEQIQAQRKNDFDAERMLGRELIQLRAQLVDLN
jgi:hypothetical protein